MRGEEPAELADGRAQREQLGVVGVHAGGVGEPGRQADGPLGHRGAHDLLHRHDVVGARRHVLPPADQRPDHAVRDQVGRVAGDAPTLETTVEPVEVLPDGAPGEVEVRRIGVPAGDLLAEHGQRVVVDRRVGQAVLAQQLGRHPLADLGQVVGLQQDLQVGVGVHVDETGCEHEAVGVEHAVGGRRGAARGQDRGDPRAVDEHVGAVAGALRPVDDGGGADERGHGTLFLRSRCGRGRRRRDPAPPARRPPGSPATCRRPCRGGTGPAGRRGRRPVRCRGAGAGTRAGR